MTDYFDSERQKRTRDWQGYEWPDFLWFVGGIMLCALIVGLNLAGPALWKVMR